MIHCIWQLKSTLENWGTVSRSFLKDVLGTSSAMLWLFGLVRLDTAVNKQEQSYGEKQVQAVL